MMSDKLKNINDLFKDSFDGFKVDPAPDVWDKIEDKMMLNQGSGTFREAFRDFKVQPGTKVWNIIRRKLWFADFVSFSPLNFNIYYAGVAALMTGGILYYSGAFDEAPVLSEESNTIAVVDNEETRDNDKLSNKANIASFIEEADKIEAGTAIQPEILTNNNKETTKNISEERITMKMPEAVVSEDVSNQAGEPDNDMSDYILENPASKETIAETGITEKIIPEERPETQDNKDEQVILRPDGADEIIAEVETVKLILQEEKGNIPVMDERDIINGIEIAEIYPGEHEVISDAEKKPEQDDLTTEKDTATDLISEEIPWPDTVGTDAYGNDIIIETTNWSVDVNYSQLGTWSTITASMPENAEYISRRDLSEAPTYFTYSIGANMNCTFKNVLFQTGLFYTQLGEEFSHGTQTVIIDSNYFYDYYQSEHYDIDTIWFTNLDSLLNDPDDPYLTPYYDTTVYVINDSTLVEDIDTTTGQSQYYEMLNRYSYMEIPLLVGYEFKTKNMTWYMKGGVIAGVLLNAKGKSISLYDNNLVMDINKNTMPFAQISSSYIVGGGIIYHISNKFGLNAEIYHRGNINSIFSDNCDVVQKYRSLGLKAGIRYSLR